VVGSWRSGRNTAAPSVASGEILKVGTRQEQPSGAPASGFLRTCAADGRSHEYSPANAAAAASP